MLPILLRVGPVTIYSFGLFVTLALLVGMFWFWRLAKGLQTTQEEVFDAAFLSIFGGLIGARLLYIIMHPSIFAKHLVAVVDIFHYPGFVYYGAVAGGLLVLVWYSRRQKFFERQLLDNAALSICIAHAIGLLGAFLGGTAYGAQTNFLWGVPMLGLLGKRHPTQLIECVFELIVFVFLYQIYKRRHQSGIIAVFYILGYATFRYFIEFLRGDSVYWFSIKSQFIVSACVIVITLLYLKRRFVLPQKKGDRL